MIKPAYYNEHDLYAAQWLRNLIAAGHIAPGDVDTRSIEDVKPDDLRPYAQCHFFAGIGVWSVALRRAGWPDDRAIWTGSCPCQPFSAAGEGAAFADERHLWPALFHLITQRRPAVVVGEQVASKDANAWIDLVQADMESLGYPFGAVAFPSAGVGAPHIRDRTYWVADAKRGYSEQHSRSGPRSGDSSSAGSSSELEGCGDSSGLGHADRIDAGRDSGAFARAEAGSGGGGRIDGNLRVGADVASGLGGLVHTDGGHAGAEREQRGGQQRQQSQDGGRLRMAPGAAFDADTGAGPTNGLWRDVDWLFCRDGKWRPVESGTFPLAHGAPARVGRLRAYGNAVNVEAARVFLDAFVNSN